MSMTQSRFFSESSGASVEIETSGRTIRPLLSMPRRLVDEAELTFASDRVYTAAVDAANVGMIELTAYPRAFDYYDVHGADEVTIGANLNSYREALSDARLGKSTDDPVSLDIDATRTLVETEREYETTTLSKTDERLNLDPDALRERPDPPSIDLSYTATVDVDAFCDAIGYIGTDAVCFIERDGDLLIAAERGDDADGGDYSTLVELDGVAEPARDDPEIGAESVFSMDYVDDMADGLDDGKVTDLTVHWGQQFPLFLEFERREDDELLYEGRYMMAPRIVKDGDSA